jgi:lysophospholipase L1-like esterase
MGALPLVLAEGGLRLHGLGVPAQWFVVRGEGPDAMVETATYDPSPHLPTRLNRQSFPLAKPAGALRVVCFGGSSVYGYPYGPKGAFPSLLAAMLAEALPGRRVEVVNAGFTGGDSARALSLAREAAAFGADAWVVYSGHNEFLRYDYPDEFDVLHGFHPRAGAPVGARLEEALASSLLWRWGRGTPGGRRLAAFVADLLGRDPRGRSGRLDADIEEATYRSYEANLEDIAALARRHGATLLLSTVAGNLRSRDPLGAVLPPPLPPDDLARFRAAVEDASRAVAANAGPRAQAALDAARAVSADEAAVHFLSGAAALQAGDGNRARAEFERAVERDPRRHRAPPRINAIVRAVAERESLTLVDVEGVLGSRAPFGIVGEESIVDHVHPSMSANVAIARAVLEGLAAATVISAPLPPERSDKEWIASAGFEESDWRMATTRLALSAAGSGRASEAAQLFREAATRFPPGEEHREAEEYYLLALAAFVEASPEEAGRLLRAAREADPTRCRELDERFRQFPIAEMLGVAAHADR